MFCCHWCSNGPPSTLKSFEDLQHHIHDQFCWLCGPKYWFACHTTGYLALHFEFWMHSLKNWCMKWLYHSKCPSIRPWICIQPNKDSLVWLLFCLNKINYMFIKLILSNNNWIIKEFIIKTCKGRARWLSI